MALKIKNEIKTTDINSNSLIFKILDSGDISSINFNSEQISMYKGSSLDGMIANIYLRQVDDSGTHLTKLLGVDSPSKWAIKDNVVYYQGNFNQIDYQVILKIIEHSWFWTVKLSGDYQGKVNLYYGQDISLSSPSANEAYACQYLDHKVIEKDDSFHIITKQNQGLPFLVQSGSLNKTTAYATDGFDFFGKEYKFNNIPYYVYNDQLPSRINQYEFAYHALKSADLDVSKNPEVVFYASFADNFRTMDQSMIALEAIKDLYNQLPNDDLDSLDFKKVELKIAYQNTYPYYPINNRSKFYQSLKEDMNTLEEADKIVYSWFNENGAHFVNGKKEQLVERPHGMIQISNGFKKIDDQTMTNTNWIFGVFNSHIAFGNTNFNKFLTHNTNPLNICKLSGERIFIKVDGTYQLLTMPMLYVMDVSTSTWYYKVKKDIIKVTTSTDYSNPVVETVIESLNKRTYDFIVADQLLLGESINSKFDYYLDGTKVIFKFGENTLSKAKYPEIEFYFDTKTDGTFKYGSDEIFYANHKSRQNPILTVRYHKSTKITIMHAVKKGNEYYDFEDISLMQEKYNQEFNKHLHSFKLTSNQKNDITKFNHLVKWYTQNALIHYTSPHGLEQYGGAAWGTRDVCQGPVELFSCLGEYEIVRDIIKTLYSRQFNDNYDWPQWFMFDNYRNIQAQESHGDIIVWPIRTVANYIEQTGDYHILAEEVPYTERFEGKFVGNDTILNHIRNEIKAIVASNVKDTNLPCYGGGDWDDTLQPCNRDLTKKMVSGWTILLLIEAINKLDKCLIKYQDNHEFSKLLKKLRTAYNKYLMIDNVPAGFAYFGETEELMLHPLDQKTGIKYRLLPFNRGFISEEFSKKNINNYLEIIDQNLLHPDGVRLMNTTVHYQGGTPKIFMRAETATNFGREIGLQYVHAHIRYVEAMSHLGKGDRVYHGLNVVCPINITKHVKNALPRQANVYFSSSDGDFKSRYEADQNFDLLRTGSVKVKCGWRLYSSGPGIYLNQLISNFLGIKTYDGNLHLDPVMPKNLRGLKLTFNYRGKLLNITYNQNKVVEEVIVNGKVYHEHQDLNNYRKSGIIIDYQTLTNENEIIIN